MKELGLEVETLEEPLYASSPLGTTVSIDLICRGCELEISGILLTGNLGVMDMSEFDIILGMNWLTAYQSSLIVSVGESLPTHRTTNALHFKGTSTMFCPRLCTIRDGTDS